MTAENNQPPERTKKAVSLSLPPARLQQRVPAVSNAGRLVIAASIGVILAVADYGWKKLQATSFIVPVSGQVVLNGQPMANTYVRFCPVPRKGESPLDANPGSHAYTDSAGNFTLIQVENDQPGVVAGEHKIVLRSGHPGGGEVNSEGYADERVPFSWRKGIRSFHVSWNGPQQATFQINTIDAYSPAARRNAP